VLLAVASAFATMVEAGPTSAAPRPPEAPRRLIVKLRTGADACIGCLLAQRRPLGALVPGSRLDQRFARHGIRTARPLRRPRPAAMLALRFPGRARRASAAARAPDLDRTWVLDVAGRGDLDAVARDVAADPAVEYCEPDRVATVQLVPNDPFFGSTGSSGQPFDDLWGAKRIGAPAAWDVTRGAGVLVAGVDTGVDDDHPDLAANRWNNDGEIAGNSVDDDGNGFVDDVRGWDFADDDADPHDDYFHGTHVAGTIAALGNNGVGVVGIAYESRIMAVRGLGTTGSGASSALAEAILYAVDNGADVINASWGGLGDSQTISDAVAVAHAAGVVFVTSAGNAGADASDYFPAADPNAITVSAFTHADARASFSNFGVKIDVGAPGGGDLPPPNDYASNSILSVLASDVHPSNTPPGALVLESAGASYLRIAGTSMASPHVAGTAALVLATHPGFSVEQVRQVLRSTAIDLAPAGFDTDSGYGLVNAAAAVVAPTPLEAHITSPGSGKLVGPTDVEVTGSATGPGFASYAVDYRPLADPLGWIPIAGPIGAPVADGVLAVWDARAVADGDYLLRLRVERLGATFVDQVGLKIRNVRIDAPERLAALRGGPVEVWGTAAGGGFVSYAVEIRRPSLHGVAWVTDGITPAVPPGTPVRHGLLATVDVSSLTDGDRFDFRLTVTNTSGSKSVERLGVTVDPSLRAGWPQSVLPGGDREYLTVADLDGAGTRSILVGSGREILVFEADGSVRAGWPQSIVGSDPFAFTHASPLVADVLGDGRPEVIASNGRELMVWSADGVLQPPFPVFVSVLADAGNQWISAGDLDGDGKDDVVCSTHRGVKAVRGDGTYVPGWNAFNAGLYGRMAAIGQFLGDPRAEVARWRQATGGGKPSSRGFLDILDSSGTVIATRKVKGSTFTRVGVADMDGDGRPDFVVPEAQPNGSRPKIKLGATNLDGRKVRLRKPRVRGVQRLPSLILAFSDLDRDGRAEAWQYARVMNLGNGVEEIGQFAPWQSSLDTTPFPVVTHTLFVNPLFMDGPFGVAIGDVDGDGVQELVGGMVANGCSAGLDACAAASAPGAPIRRAVPVQRPYGSLLAGFPKPVPHFFHEPDELSFIYISGYVDDPFAATPAIADLDGDGLKEVVWYDPESSRIFVWNVPGTPGPLLADWPMYAHDPKHSNVLPATLP
jgi:subtilisin family serine protease